MVRGAPSVADSQGSPNASCNAECEETDTGHEIYFPFLVAVCRFAPHDGSKVTVLDARKSPAISYYVVARHAETTVGVAGGERELPLPYGCCQPHRRVG